MAPNFALLIEVLNLHLRFDLEMWNQHFPVLPADSLDFLSELISEEIDSLFVLLDFAGLFIKHEWEGHLAILVEQVRPTD